MQRGRPEFLYQNQSTNSPYNAHLAVHILIASQGNLDCSIIEKRFSHTQIVQKLGPRLGHNWYTLPELKRAHMIIRQKDNQPLIIHLIKNELLGKLMIESTDKKVYVANPKFSGRRKESMCYSLIEEVQSSSRTICVLVSNKKTKTLLDVFYGLVMMVFYQNQTLLLSILD